jgi:cysteine desulfurase
MSANNETGTVQPVDVVGDLAHAAGSLFLCDLTQAVGKTDIEQSLRHADVAFFSGHKIYGPKGVGALVASRQVQRLLKSFFPGGGQERGLRGGTYDTSSIAGLGEAAAIVSHQLQADVAHAAALTNRLEHLLSGLGEVQVLGGSRRLSNTLNIRFVGADAEAVMASMPDVEVSTGSACQAAVPSPSHVLLAMGLTREEASECIRFSVGRPTTLSEVEYAARRAIAAVERVRALNAA